MTSSGTIASSAASVANGLGNAARFLPLLAFTQRDAGSLSDGDLSKIAEALAGPEAANFFPLLQQLRTASPNSKGLEILGSPAAAKIYQKMREQTEGDNAVVFCKCPDCGTRFETSVT